MTKKKYSIAIAAETELYLPLYLARSKKWYNLLNNVEISLDKPSKDVTDGDQWAFNQIRHFEKAKDDQVIYNILAVGDPIKILEYKTKEVSTTDVRVVGGLVMKLAFWSYHHGDEINNIDGFKKYEKVVCPPPGMTGYDLYEYVKEKNNNLTYFNKNNNEPNDISNLLNNYENHKEGGLTVLITPNIMEMELKNNESNQPSYNKVYSFSNEPSIGNMLITGLMTKVIENDQYKGHYEVLNKILDAIQLALIDIHSRSEDAIKTLLEIHGKQNEKFSQSDKNAAKKCLNEMLDSKVFPLELSVSTAEWDNRKFLHQFSGDSNGSQLELNNERDYEPTFDSNLAKEIFQKNILSKFDQSFFNKIFRLIDPFITNTIVLIFLAYILSFSWFALLLSNWEDTWYKIWIFYGTNLMLAVIYWKRFNINNNSYFTIIVFVLLAITSTYGLTKTIDFNSVPLGQHQVQPKYVGLVENEIKKYIDDDVLNKLGVSFSLKQLKPYIKTIAIFHHLKIHNLLFFALITILFQFMTYCILAYFLDKIIKESN